MLEDIVQKIEFIAAKMELTNCCSDLYIALLNTYYGLHFFLHSLFVSTLRSTLYPLNNNC